AAEPLKLEEARQLAGRYRDGDRHLDLVESFGRLHLVRDTGGSIVRLQKSGKTVRFEDGQVSGGLVVGDIQQVGTKIFREDGKLHALIELTEIDVLTEESEDVFAFPANTGMYYGEKLVFTRDKTGRATKVTAATVAFDRRKIDGEGGETFKIKPVRPLTEIR